MLRSAWRNIILMLFVLVSCGRSLPQFEDMDLPAWKNDKNGCTGARSKMTETLLSQRGKLLALSELDVVDILGKPDQQELYKRNQKFYYYYLKPSPDCGHSSKDEALRLVIRFNAMGLAKEVVTEH